MGCGLDETGEKCGTKENLVYNLDMPDVIQVRNKLIPPDANVKNIGCDINDFSWFDAIDDNDGAIFFASGVFYYFTKEQIEALVNAMAKRFKEGVVVFDIGGKAAVKAAVKVWIKTSGIEGVDTLFYVDSLEKDVNPWLKNAIATSRGYMTGYFDLKVKSIPSYFRGLAKVADKVMKMQIIRIAFK